jgi:hypothetical protein
MVLKKIKTKAKQMKKKNSFEKSEIGQKKMSKIQKIKKEFFFRCFAFAIFPTSCREL